jgi:hypothetical protein
MWTSVGNQNDTHAEIKNRAKIQTFDFLNLKQRFELCAVRFRSKELGAEIF